MLYDGYLCALNVVSDILLGSTVIQTTDGILNVYLGVYSICVYIVSVLEHC